MSKYRHMVYPMMLVLSANRRGPKAFEDFPFVISEHWSYEHQCWVYRTVEGQQPLELDSAEWVKALKNPNKFIRWEEDEDAN